MSQIALPFEWPDDPCDDDFLVTASNAAAVQMLEHWATWPVRTALLVGPRKSGRSLLARIFAAKSGGTILDDGDQRAEAELFHAWNVAQEGRRPLLIVAQEAPPEWAIRLPDLRSRLAASPVTRLEAPDDALVRALLRRGFLKRGMDARDELIDWLAGRIERSHIAVIRVIDALEAEALGRRRRLTTALARTVLARAALIEES
jgi:chromosomal replication initiation ATPase DnaA